MKQKTIFSCSVLFLALFSGLLQSNSVELDHQAFHAVPSDTVWQRKFSVSLLLHGIANTCSQLGNAVAAENDKEKQQAALGVIGSLFSLAGHITAEDEAKSDKKNQRNYEIQSADKLVELIEHVFQHDLLAMKDVDRPILASIAAIESPELRKIEIMKFLNNHPEIKKAFLKEVFGFLKDVVIKYTPSLIDLFHKYVSKTVQEVTVLRTAMKFEGKDLSDQVVSTINATCDLISGILSQESIIGYAEHQLMSLLEYIHEHYVGD